MDIHDTKRVHLRGAPGIQSNVPAIYPFTLPPNITPSHSPGTLPSPPPCPSPPPGRRFPPTPGGTVAK